MILNAFSTFLKDNNHEIINGNTTAIKLLCKWIRMVIAQNPKNNVDKIVQTEITLAENEYGDFLIVGKSESGRILVNALYNYAMSYEHYISKNGSMTKTRMILKFSKSYIQSADFILFLQSKIIM